MKKFLLAKKGWLFAGAGALLIMVMVLSARLLPNLPNTNAKYVSDTDQIDTGINGISDNDLEKLFRHFMNERYPVGSIYMTADPNCNTTQAMTDRFGGTWVAWGQKKVPVGVNPAGADHDAASIQVDGTGVAITNWGQTGGRTPGGGANNATVAVAGTITGAIGLTGGGAAWNAITPPQVSFSGGSITLSKNANHPGGTGGTTYPSNDTTPAAGAKSLTAANFVSHNHTVTVSYWQGNLNHRSCGSPNCPQNQSDYPGATSGTSQTLNLTSTGTGSSFTAYPTRTLSTALPSNLIYYNAPTISVTNPGWSYADQTASNANLTFSYSGNTTITDNTLQPYVLCYMFKRTGLEPL